MFKKGIMLSFISVILMLSFSWIGVSALVWLISLCFDFTFTIKIGTGVWLSMCLLNMSLKISVRGGK